MGGLMINISTRGMNKVRAESVDIEAQCVGSEGNSQGQQFSEVFDRHVSMSEAAFWNGHLDSSRIGLRRLTEKVNSLCDTKGPHGVERVKFLSDLNG